MTLYHYDNETGIVTPPVELLSNICESDCHKNGDCVNSKFVLAGCSLSYMAGIGSVTGMEHINYVNDDNLA